MRFIPGNAQHTGNREQQQDSMGFSDPADKAFVEHGGFLGVLADGMGGMALGTLASRTAVSQFLTSYMAKPEEESIPEALLRALHDANQAVLALASQRGLAEEMGTTLVAAVADGRSLYWISAGDSRAYLIRQGRLSQLTVDHVFANELEREVVSGRLSRTEALRHPERNDLTSYLGKAELTEIDRNIRPLTLEPHDRVIVCSDGAYKSLSESEMAGAGLGSAQQSCEDLIARVLAKQTPRQDNVTVLAIDCQPDRVAIAARATHWIRNNISLAAAAVVIVLVAFAGIWRWTKRVDSGEGAAQFIQSQGQGQQHNSNANQDHGEGGQDRDPTGNRSHKQDNKDLNQSEHAGAANSGAGADPNNQDARPQDQPRKREDTQPTPTPNGAPAPQEPAAPRASPGRHLDQQEEAGKGNSLGNSLRRIKKEIGRAAGRPSA
jgi:serine/threonine protein phosphatase PrpC